MSVSLSDTAMGTMAYLFLQAVNRPERFPEVMLEELTMFVTAVDGASERDFSIMNATLKEELLEGTYLTNGIESFEEKLEIFYDVIEADRNGKLYTTVIENIRATLGLEA